MRRCKRSLHRLALHHTRIELTFLDASSIVRRPTSAYAGPRNFRTNPIPGQDLDRMHANLGAQEFVSAWGDRGSSVPTESAAQV